MNNNIETLLNQYSNIYLSVKYLNANNLLNEDGQKLVKDLKKIDLYSKTVEKIASKKRRGFIVQLNEVFTEMYKSAFIYPSAKEYARQTGRTYVYVQKIKQNITDDIEQILTLSDKDIEDYVKYKYQKKLL